jgi:hypothetical protein
MAPPFSLSGNKLRVYSSLTATHLRLVAPPEHLIQNAMRCFQGDGLRRRGLQTNHALPKTMLSLSFGGRTASHLTWARWRSPLEHWRS